MVGLALSGLFGVTGCGALMPEMGSYKSTIPEAMAASDLEVQQTLVGTGIDGLSRNVRVNVCLNHDKITASTLHETISIVVPFIDQPGADKLILNFSDCSDGVGSDKALFESLSVEAAREKLLSDWGLGKKFGYADSAADEILGDIADLKQYLRDTAQ